MTTQTKREELLALADRCEKEEASREIDVRIFLALNDPPILVIDDTADRFPRPSKHVPARSIWGDDWPHWGNPREVKDVALTLSCPAYTTSLDAAVTLVPEGAEWDLTTLYGVARVAVGLNLNEGPHYASHEGGLLPLAICAAALRARASLMEGE